MDECAVEFKRMPPLRKAPAYDKALMTEFRPWFLGGTDRTFR